MEIFEKDNTSPAWLIKLATNFYRSFEGLHLLRQKVLIQDTCKSL